MTTSTKTKIYTCSSWRILSWYRVVLELVSLINPSHVLVVHYYHFRTWYRDFASILLLSLRSLSSTWVTHCGKHLRIFFVLLHCCYQVPTLAWLVLSSLCYGNLLQCFWKAMPINLSSSTQVDILLQELLEKSSSGEEDITEHLVVIATWLLPSHTGSLLNWQILLVAFDVCSKL